VLKYIEMLLYEVIGVFSFQVQPVSMVSKDGLQRVDLTYCCDRTVHLFLSVFKKDCALVSKLPVAFSAGRGVATVMLPVQKESFSARWVLTDKEGHTVAETQRQWEKPRERTMYLMLSSHTDIGLHNSQYIQRHNSCRFLDKAKALCDETENRNEENRYRYTIEGTWFWNNYGMDRGADAVNTLVRNYIKQGKIGVCCGVAGNHTQVYGLEELCRSAYEKKRLEDTWGITSKTMTMIDNNGMSMGIIAPYSEAGIRNIIFAPNQWNPLPSTLWKMDATKTAATWNPDAGGGGARIDIRYESELPMVFYWQAPTGERILVWGSTQYTHGASAFGLYPEKPTSLPLIEDSMAKQLPLLDEKYPYDVWLMCCYADDQEPDLKVTDHITAWNQKWQWPKLRTLGDPDEPFRILREKHEDQIPVVTGDIAGGWYQHPAATPELLAEKFAADRLLPTAEKWSAVAGVLDEAYTYPAQAFRRAWDYLLFNDEHSYGTSGYEGRRVYETWMQHRDWIEKATQTAQTETDRALQAIAARIPAECDSFAIFNPTGLQRQELVETENGSALTDIPPFGYKVLAKTALQVSNAETAQTSTPPVIENDYYKIVFRKNGSFASIYDKTLCRELLDANSAYGCNELVYTKDHHKTFLVPEQADFTVIKKPEKTVVSVRATIPELGADIQQTIFLPAHEKRIDIDNRLYHVKDMVNTNRYYRYLYCAFPFGVENARRYCHLNGAVAEYGTDVTGHGTDVYMAVNEWCCAENKDFGVALMMADSQLMEFDHIHPDKTDFGNVGDGSGMFAYLANDWLQMHTPGGSHLDYQFRFSIVSYEGNYQTADIPQIAERYCNPVQIVEIPQQKGDLDRTSQSFLQIPKGQRLSGLKRADDGDGMIARLYGDSTAVFAGQRVRIDETPLQADTKPASRFSTYRIGSGVIRLKARELPQVDSSPAPIGSIYTGLITEPCAAAGEHPGHLYLLWGHNTEEDFSHYKLYRSEQSGFVPDAHSFLAEVSPEEYCVGRYEDKHLKDHTPYYYRVCAVNKAGKAGPFSREFCGITKELLEETV